MVMIPVFLQMKNGIRFKSPTTPYFPRSDCVNYTTYDIRRDCDTINTSTCRYVVLQSPEVSTNAHPYWYAQVLGIYHAGVSMTHPAALKHSAQHMQFLWVLWLGVEPGYRSGSKVACLPKVSFVEDADEDVFGFLDPDLIIRGCHLIPDF